MKNVLLTAHLILILTFCNLLSAQTNTNISGVINSYAHVDSTNSAFTTLYIGSGINGFQSGDRVLIIQMKGAAVDTSNTANYGKITNMNSAGRYEFAMIQSLTSTSITLSTALLNTYDLSASVQLVKVPSYTTQNVTITSTLTCDPWNPLTQTGGILVLSAPNSKLILAADIDVTGKGFGGGKSSANLTTGCKSGYFYASGVLSGDKGEGYAILTSTHQAGAGRIANGGGGGNDVNLGGAGGGNGGSGGRGGNGWGCSTSPAVGGDSIDYSTYPARLFPGGGGGGSHQNDDNGTDGGAGGAVVILIVNSVDGQNFKIVSDGETGGTTGGTNFDDAAGGGGGGGTICIKTNSYNSSNLNISARGGRGGNLGSSIVLGPGGGGGGGRFYYSAGTLPGNVSVDLSAGAAGVNTSGNANMAKAGTNGVSMPNFQPNGWISTSLANTESSTQFQVYPNPFTGEIQIRLTTPLNIENAVYTLYDMTGKEITRISVSDPSELTHLNLSHLKAGVYTLSLQLTDYDGKMVLGPISKLIKY